MNTFWERIEHLRTISDMTQERLSKKIGLSHRAIGSWKQRQHIPPGDVCVSLAKLFGTTVEYLITGEELPLPDEVDSNITVSEAQAIYNANGKAKITNNEEPTLLVPIAPQRLSAGYGEDFLSEFGVDGHVRILQRMARGIDSKRLAAAVVKGDSMQGIHIFSGDVVVFAQGYADENGIYVISLYGEVKVKRLEFRAVEQMIYIHSENQRYSSESIPLNDENLIILGKVIGWVHCHPY